MKPLYPLNPVLLWDSGLRPPGGLDTRKRTYKYTTYSCSSLLWHRNGIRPSIYTPKSGSILRVALHRERCELCVMGAGTTSLLAHLSMATSYMSRPTYGRDAVKKLLRWHVTPNYGFVRRICRCEFLVEPNLPAGPQAGLLAGICTIGPR